MDKSELRKIYLDRRKAISDREFLRRNEALLSMVKAERDLIGLGPVHIFLPIEKFREVNTWPIVHWLWDGGIRTMTSIANVSQDTLSHVWFDAQTCFEQNKWGIPEPVGARSADPNLCTVVFVPLLVADDQGNRIGYGKGFYDRFLSTLTPKTKTIGLSLLSLTAERIPCEPHDHALNKVVTPGF